MRLSYVKGEKWLVKAAIRSDESAQKAIYERFAPRMLPVCMRYARDTMEAEDILQDGFVRVFEKLKSFRFEGSLEGWIRKIILNVAIRQYQKNTKMYVLVGMEKADTEENAVTPSDNLELQDILDMIQKLPDGYRLVFNMYAIEGYSHAEIAKMLEISEVTSRSQLARARKSLIKMIGSYDAVNHSLIRME